MWHSPRWLCRLIVACHKLWTLLLLLELSTSVMGIAGMQQAVYGMRHKVSCTSRLGGSCFGECKFEIKNKFMYPVLQPSNLIPWHMAQIMNSCCAHKRATSARPSRRLLLSFPPLQQLPLSLLFTSHLQQFSECQIAMTICGRLWRACAADATKNATYTMHIPLVQH